MKSTSLRYFALLAVFGSNLFASLPRYERADLQYSTRTRYPQYAGVPQLTTPDAGQLPKYYRKLAFSGGYESASSPLTRALAGGRPAQNRTELSGSIIYTYNPTTDSVPWTNNTLIQRGTVYDVPAWSPDADPWPMAPVLTVEVPVSGNDQVGYGVWYISESNPLRIPVLSSVRAADDNQFRGGVFGGVSTTAVEWQDYRVMELQDEDTQEVAESRAKVYPVSDATDPNSVTSIRGTPKQGRHWMIREVTVTLRFTPSRSCGNAPFERRIVLMKRAIGTQAWEDYQTTTDQVTVEGGSYVGSYTLPLLEDHEVRVADITFEPMPGCGGSCSIDGLAGGGSGPKSGSIQWALPLGRGPDGESAGSLLLHASAIDASLYTPSALRATVAAGAATVIRDAGGQLRQILVPQAIVDIVVAGPLAYEIRFHDRGAAGAPDASGVYAISGDPYMVWRIDSPDGSTSRVRFARQMGSQSFVTEVDESQPGHRLLSEAGGLRVTETTESTEGGDRVETVEVRNSAGAVSAKTKTYYHAFAWGEERVKEIADPDGAALTTEWTYVTSAGSGAYRKIASIKRPDGYLETMTYSADATGQLVASSVPLWQNHTKGTLFLVTRPDVDSDGEADYVMAVSEGQFLTRLSLNFQIELAAPRTINGVKYTLREQRRATVPDVVWNDAGNLITYERYYAEGPYQGKLAYRLRPEGTLFRQNFTANADGGMTITTEEGAADPSRESVVDGTRTITVNTSRGFLQSRTVVDIASGATVESQVVAQADAAGRPTRIFHLDGAEEIRGYCASCGSVDHTELRGEIVDYEFDALNRKVLETRRAGTTTLSRTRFEYDASDRLTKTFRINPDDGSETVVGSTAYDLAGRVVSTASLGQGATNYTYAFGAENSTITTTTYADGGTRIESYGPSGTLFKLQGTAVVPVEYAWGAREWWGGGTGYLAYVRRYYDATSFVTERSGVNFLGEVADTTFDDGSVSRRYFDSLGRLIRSVDQDGVATLYGYDALGRQSVTAIDVNGNGTIDYAGTDRITRTVSDVGAHGGTTVRRTATQIWETDGQDTPTTISLSEQSVDGLRTWQTVRGLATATVMTYDGAGGRTITTTTPDGGQVIQTYLGDRLLDTITRDSGGAQLTATTQHYDALGQLDSTTDVRNGTTTYVYDADGRVQSVTTPDPDSVSSGPGYDAQTTRYTYDSLGRVASVTQPDGGVVNTTYWPHGQPRRTWGARTTPVEYTYNVRQQVQTMTTWQDFAGDTGKAVTTWNYIPVGGFLLNKRYADNTGPSYTYRPSGRLLTRTWARGVACTYGYNAAGDLVGVTYSDGTPAVTIAYDRTGRPRTITDGSGTRTLSYDPVSGQLQNEDYTAGLLAGLGVHRTFDPLSRLSGVSALNSQLSTLSSVTYAYDDASRLGTVTSGANTATYSYLPNSPLVGTVAFAQAGTTRLTTTKVYDNLNRLGSISSALSASSALNYSYSYNSANQRTKLTREDNAYWDYGYDALGQVTTGRKYQSGGAPLNGFDFAWTYDDIGNRKTATANSRLATYTVNSLNQYTARTVPGGFDVLAAAAPDATVTHTYPADSAGALPKPLPRLGDYLYQPLTVDNAASAQLAQVKVTGVKNNVGPNGEDAVTEITRSAFIPRTPESFIHDADGNLTDDARWHYTWDGENRLMAVETSLAAQSVGVPNTRLDFAYDSQGRRVQKRVRTSPLAGLVNVRRDYFGGNTLTGAPASTVFGGNIDDLWFRGEGLPYAVPLSYRVTATFYAPASGAWTLQSNLGAAGARVYLDDVLVLDQWNGSSVPPVTLALTAGRAYRLRYECQLFANVPGGTSYRSQLAWSGPGVALQAVPNAASTALNPTTSETRFLYDGWNLLTEVNESGAAARSYAWGLDLSGSLQGAGGVGGLLFASRGSATHAPAFDGNGNVSGYVDMATGAKSATYEYGVFGETLIADGPLAEAFTFRFSTKYADAETGLIDYGQRFYDPNRGRFLSRDPIEEEGGYNLYGFVGNDPLDHIDLLGKRILIVGHLAAAPLGKLTKPDSYHIAIYIELDGKDPCCNLAIRLTLGAQRENGLLVKEANYPGDALSNAMFTQELQLPSGVSECDFAKRLIRANASYRDNLEYSLPDIKIIPFRRDGVMLPGKYNSNSFVSGILSASGLTPPTLNTDGRFQTPGYSNPIPLPAQN